MTITLDADLEARLAEAAAKQGTKPEALAVEALRQRILTHTLVFEPRDEWERRLLSIASDYGVSLSDEALNRENV